MNRLLKRMTKIMSKIQLIVIILLPNYFIKDCLCDDNLKDKNFIDFKESSNYFLFEYL